MNQRRSFLTLYLERLGFRVDDQLFSPDSPENLLIQPLCYLAKNVTGLGDWEFHWVVGYGPFSDGLGFDVRALANTLETVDVTIQGAFDSRTVNALGRVAEIFTQTPLAIASEHFWRMIAARHYAKHIDSMKPDGVLRLFASELPDLQPLLINGYCISQELESLQKELRTRR